MSTPESAILFTPVDFGPVRLKHRVVMAPLTRSRSIQPDSVPGDLMAEYYDQRASDGGLIIGEATNISLTSRGWFGAPGLYTEAQVEGWKKVLARVHAKGGKMFAQLWHTGRASHVSMTGGADPVSASVNPQYWQDETKLTSTPGGWVKPSPHRALKISEIKSIVEDYRAAAKRALDAGFDGVELHAANGYLIDQFLQDNSNHRTDEYGGSIPNRARFLLEVVPALISVWGADRVAVRIGPGGKWNNMDDSNPDALFGYVAEQLNQFGLAYLHVVEPRVKGNIVVGGDDQPPIGAERLQDLQGQDHRGRRLRARKRGTDHRIGKRRRRSLRPSLHLQPRPARTHPARPAADGVRSQHFLHLRPKGIHRLLSIRIKVIGAL